jgi:hypothetical protein
MPEFSQNTFTIVDFLVVTISADRAKPFTKTNHQISMKPKSSNLFAIAPVRTRAALLTAALLGFGASSAAFADTITTAVDVRTVSGGGNQSTNANLSLYNVGSNVQYTWLNFDLSAYGRATFFL